MSDSAKLIDAYSSEELAVEVDHVDKFFGEYHILRDLCFKVPRGKITTILGFSGAGKSTLLKHILGLLMPTKGTIKVLGHDLSHMSELQLREFRRKFGMLFQYAALFDSLTAFENIAFPLREFTTKTEAEIKERVFSLIEAVGLSSDSAQKIPSELSGGMRKRVGLARALALRPEIILYDEPTTGLDPITTKMVNDLILDTSQRNQDIKMTSVVISHDVQASLRISDYVAFLERGTIVEFLPTNDFQHSTNPTIRKFLDL
jgi:phospholipid/cholesterol/gamma-HCH transport system ATP-binding protein